MTALEALRAIDPAAAADLDKRVQGWAADRFRRLHDARDKPEWADCWLELDIGTFAAFRKAGGESS